MTDVRASFEAIAAKYGPSYRSYCGIGDSSLRLGDYEEAERSFSGAVRLTSANCQAAAGLREARELLQVGAGVSPLLAHEDILQIRRYPFPRLGRSWIVLCGKRITPDPDGPRCRFAGPLILRLFVQKADGYLCVWKTQMGQGLMTGGDLGVFDAQVYVQDFSGDGTPQLAFQEIFPGGSTEPTHLRIFAWNGRGLSTVLDLESTAPFWLEDIRHNGTYQVWKSEEIGFTMCHADQPRWTDIYAWRQGRYRLADRSYPGEYRHWIRDLRDSLRRSRRDADILAHLAATYAILGMRRESRGAFHAAEAPSSQKDDHRQYLIQLARANAIAVRSVRAVSLYRSALHECGRQAASEKDPDMREYDAWLMRQLRQEMSELSV